MSLTSPGAWFAQSDHKQAFDDRLRATPRPVLICDYDGTLAPFHADKMQAVPFPGVTERLDRIHAGKTRLIFVSGRQLAELLTLVPLVSEIEVWGSHGREHRMPATSASRRPQYSVFDAPQELVSALDQVQAALAAAGYQQETERKAASIAVHWRNLGDDDARMLEARAGEVFREHAAHESFAVMPFESGLELRVADRTKAHAVEAVLADEPDDAAVAYLGDDTTDEDAFRALGSRGLSLLVRTEARPSLAQGWLQPPQELLRFFDDWIALTDEKESRA